MNYPYTVPDDLFDNLLWPSAISEPGAAWTWDAGYAAQQGRDEENVTFEELEALAGWEKNPPMPPNQDIWQDIPVSAFDCRYETESLHSS